MNKAASIIADIIQTDELEAGLLRRRADLLDALRRECEQAGLWAIPECDPVVFRCGNVVVTWSHMNVFEFDLVRTFEEVVELEKRSVQKVDDDEIPY